MARETEAGLLGTVGYMSLEQVRGSVEPGRTSSHGPLRDASGRRAFRGKLVDTDAGDLREEPPDLYGFVTFRRR